MSKNDGVQNEQNIVSTLNNKQYNELADCHKKFIRQLEPKILEDTIISARKIGGQGLKPDIKLSILQNDWFVSVKKGGGNSIHQESINYFLHYCSTLGMTPEEQDDLLLFLYGDGTTNGDSSPEERMEMSEIKELYKEEIAKVQAYFDKNKRNLIERFLIYGRLGHEKNIHANYLYHGDSIDGVWCPLNDDAIDYITTLPNAKDAPLSIGPFSVQVWNRNLNGKPEFEKRRHSIQIKWGSCKNTIPLINEYCQKNIPPNISENIQKESTLLGDNSQGFDNQKKVAAIINGKRYKDLPLNLKNMIKTMYPSIANTEHVFVNEVKGTKYNLLVNVNNEKKTLSVSKGSGNSVHQEKIEGFLNYCVTKLNMTIEEKNAFLLIHYADGTIDGSAPFNNRIDGELIKRNLSKEINIVQKFINKNKRDLLERFLIYGKNGKENGNKADFVYYGTISNGIIADYQSLIDYLISIENSQNAILSIGHLSLQTWNRNLKGKPKLESRRQSIQVKWSHLKNDIINYNSINSINQGTINGNWEEYELVSKLNKNKNINNSLWSVLAKSLNLNDLTNIFAVRISNMVYSNLAETYVLPKSDVYLVKGLIPHQTLIEYNYWIDEDSVSDLKLEPLSMSGISCKRPNSKNFTYAKLSINSFLKLFEYPEIGAGISLFVTDNELVNNDLVLKGWKTTKENLFEFIEKESKCKIKEKSLENKETCKLIKQYCIDLMKNAILNNSNISNAIFNGDGIFDEPYNAKFIYSNGHLNLNYIPQFSITTGSGRHKGIFTIIVKP